MRDKYLQRKKPRSISFIFAEKPFPGGLRPELHPSWLLLWSKRPTARAFSTGRSLLAAFIQSIPDMSILFQSKIISRWTYSARQTAIDDSEASLQVEQRIFFPAFLSLLDCFSSEMHFQTLFHNRSSDCNLHKRYPILFAQLRLQKEKSNLSQDQISLSDFFL